ncbi:MAG: hypothetical protein LBC88_04235 [Spirochaetaceae bacterium]|jgi:hypothetical protein|nr:hypothetical protein [Spirochaetaceae bacterium]
MNANEEASGLPEKLTGLWDSYADSYIISTGRIEYDDGSYGAWRLNFAGNIRHSAAFNRETGVIIIEYTEPSEVPYETGRSNFIAIYYKELSPGAAKFWNSYDTTGIDTLTLADAVEKFSEANSSRFVFSWDSAYTLYRQKTPVFNMGRLRGNWRGNDAFGSWLKITDHRLSVYMAVISPATIVYSGAITAVTDVEADAGIICIQFTGEDDTGLVGARLHAKAGDFYALRWRRGEGDVSFSVYNDNPAVLSHDSETPAAFTPEDDIFENGHEGGLALSGEISVTFTQG